MKIEGLSRLKAILYAMANKVPQKTKLAVKKAGVNLQTNAKNDAPIDTGKLRQSISLKMSPDGYEAKVSAGGASAPYAPYIEFGTGGAVQIPTGWEDLAAEFRGKGVKTISLKPRPYLIPNFEKQAAELKKELEEIITPR